MLDLYRKYYDWIDWDMFDGLSDEEREKLEDKNREKYGLNYILRSDAPLEAVLAWREDARQSKEADKDGEIID